MKRFFLILFVIPFTVGISAQESEIVISADRPGMATGVDVMPFRGVQWETGFQYDYAGGAHSITLPTTLFRFGITRFAELRVAYDGSLASGDGKQWEYAVEPLVLGTKIKFFEGTENEKLQWLSAVSFLFNLAIPSTPDYGKNTAGSANLDFGFTYLVHPRVQLDVYGAFNCQDPVSSANVGLGVAWMIK